MPIRLIAVSLAKIKAIYAAASLSGMLGFAFTEALTSQWGLAALSSVIASVGGAILVAIPRIISVRSEADGRAEASRENATNNLIARMTAFHGEEIKFYQGRVAEKELIATLERKSKHKALGECQRLSFHITFLQTILRDRQCDPPEFKIVTYEELVGDEDKQIEDVAQQRLAKSPPITPIFDKSVSTY